VSKNIVEGTYVFVLLPTVYYKNNAVYNYYMLDKFNGVTI